MVVLESGRVSTLWKCGRITYQTTLSSHLRFVLMNLKWDLNSILLHIQFFPYRFSTIWCHITIVSVCSSHTFSLQLDCMLFRARNHTLSSSPYIFSLRKPVYTHWLILKVSHHLSSELLTNIYHLWLKLDILQVH